MYNADDFRAVERHARRCGMVFGSILAAAVVLYVAAILAGMRLVMLAVLLAAFLFAVFYGDFWLLPAYRYRRFMREIESGLRRNLECSVDVRSDEIELQDGVQVFAQQVRLKDGDTRIFYLNADHRNRFPAEGNQIRLQSYGRHITGCEILSGEE